MKIGLRQIKYFIAVAEDLHFRRAAERIGIAQPALSRTVRSLEQELGVRLFVRDNRNVQLTEAGKHFLEGCQKVVATLEQTVKQSRRVYQGNAGELRLGFTDDAIAGNLPNILKSVKALHTDIVIRPFHGPTVAQIQRLEIGDLDIGFVTGPINRLGYDQIKVQSERFVCVTYASHPLAGRESVRLGDLSEEDFVHGSSNEWQHFYAYLLPLCRRAGFVPNIVQEAVNTEGILGLVASEMGLTILAGTFTPPKHTGLSVIPIEDVKEELQTMAIWKTDKLTGPAKLFIDYIRSVT